MRLIQIKSCLILVFAFACSPKSRIITDVPGYKLTWSDEFDGKTLDTSKWAFRVDNKHRSIQRRENVNIEGGHLILNLEILDAEIDGKKASGAGIVSKERFKYGYYEVRAKLGDGLDDDQDGIFDEGWHHSFWAMAAEVKGDEVSTTYPGIRRTEIDCFENPTEHRWESDLDGLANFTQHVIVWDENGKEWGRLPKPMGDRSSIIDFKSEDWHTYAFKWTEEEIVFFVDGEITHRALYPKDKFVHDNINVWLTAISTNWNKPGQEKSRAIYDYFRYYTKS